MTRIIMKSEVGYGSTPLEGVKERNELLVAETLTSIFPNSWDKAEIGRVAIAAVKAIDRIHAEKEEAEKLEKLHQRLLKLKTGDTVHFDFLDEASVNFNPNADSGKLLNIVKADTAVVYRYQTRKRLLWLKFDHIENGTYRDNLLPFKLKKVLTMKLHRGKERESGQC